MVHTELAALTVEPLLGRAGAAVDLAGVAGVGVDQDELADVVKERGDRELVALAELGLAREPLRGTLGGHGVEPEALRRRVPPRDALEEVEDGGAGGERLHATRGEELDGLGDGGNPGALG